MGIRVQKFLGYGLDDVQYDKEKWKFTDPRINPESWALQYDKEPSIDDYGSWLEKHSCSLYEFEDGRTAAISLDGWYIRDKEKRKSFKRTRSLHDCFVHQPEYGLPNVLMVQPLAMHDWQRSDDPIDYVFEVELFEANKDYTRDRLDRLQYGLYPYNGLYMDKRTGEKLKGVYPHIINLIRSGQLEFEDVDRIEGFSSSAEIRENAVPVIPDEVRDLVTYSKLFTSDDVWLQLRPMLYTYWA